MIAIRLLGNRLHVRRLAPATISAGGIHIPGQYQDDRTQYQVLGVGPKVQEINPGDCVMAMNYHGNLVDLGDGTAILDAKEAIAVWR